MSRATSRACCVVGLLWSASAAMLFAAACSGDDTTDDADADVAGADDSPGTDDGGIEIPQPIPPSPPVLTPCPAGWREVTDPETGTVTCDPWPESGYEECSAVDEAHFPGEPGCVRIGTACEADDDWATDLPAGEDIRFVRPGAPSGGLGTRGSPFRTIAEAMVGAVRGTIIALAGGRYDEVVELPAGVTLWGACIAETVVSSSAASDLAAVITAAGDGAVVGNLRIEGDRLGLLAGGNGRTLELHAVVVNGVVDTGVWVPDGGRLVAEGLVVRDTRGAPLTRARGRGLEVSREGSADVRHAVFAGNREVGVAIADARTSVTLSDVVLRDTQSQESGEPLGRGLQVSAGATVEVRRGVFERNRETAIVAADAGTALALEDAVIRDTRSRETDRQLGRGLQVSGGATVEVRRGVFERNRDIAVAVYQASTSLTLEDAVVRDTQSQESDLLFGRGLQVTGGAAVEVRRGVFERNRDIAVAAYETTTTVTLEDMVVRDTQGRERDRRLGRGLNVEDGARTQVTRGVFEGNRGVAVLALASGTSVTLGDVVVNDTQSEDCADDSCAGAGGGTGVTSCGGASVVANRFRVTKSTLCGVQLANCTDEAGTDFPVGGTMDLHDGEVANNAVCGANVQTEGFDVRRLMDNVWFHHNPRNLDGDDLEVPSPSNPVPSE